MKEKQATNFIFTLFITSLIFTSCSSPNKKEKKSEKGGNISYEVYEIKDGDGWGYKILLNDKPFINQDRIPAISGGQIFTSEDDAKKVAKRVIKKLQNRKSPAISKEDLKELNIQFEE